MKSFPSKKINLEEKLEKVTKRSAQQSRTSEGKSDRETAMTDHV